MHGNTEGQSPACYYYGKDVTLTWREGRDTIDTQFLWHHIRIATKITNRTTLYNNKRTSSGVNWEESFSNYISNSLIIVTCTRDVGGNLMCIFVSESIDIEWTQKYQMEQYPLASFATSTAPNGNDIWLSGGFSTNDVIRTIHVMR